MNLTFASKPSNRHSDRNLIEIGNELLASENFQQIDDILREECKKKNLRRAVLSYLKDDQFHEDALENTNPQK